MNDSSPLGTLALHFLALSLFAIGGINVVLPEMHRQMVEVTGWMTEAEFIRAYAIGQAAPGPNMLVVTLIGWQVAGVTGAVVATLAMCGPTCLAAYFIGGLWDRFRHARWRRALQHGLVPLAVGLIMASGALLAQGAARSTGALVLIAVSAVTLFATRISPIWLLAVGGAAGALGLI